GGANFIGHPGANLDPPHCNGGSVPLLVDFDGIFGVLPMKIRDRIVELRRVSPKELRPNPKNWRTHPKQQRDVLKGLLAEVGIADAVLAYDPGDGGGLMIIDGHLRTEELASMEEVPVLILDVNEQEADKLLATLDPVSALAGKDDEKLIELLKGVETDSEAVLDRKSTRLNSSHVK